MPTYSYACTECEHRFDTVQAFTDASLTDCPECRGRLRKLFSSVGIVFKGSGFYRTDSRSGGPNGAGEKSDSTAESTSGSGSTAKSTGQSGSSSESSSADSSSGSGSSAGSSSGSPSSAGAASSSGRSKSASAAAS